jgi:hypothetical protein
MPLAQLQLQHAAMRRQARQALLVLLAVAECAS